MVYNQLNLDEDNHESFFDLTTTISSIYRQLVGHRNPFFAASKKNYRENQITRIQRTE
jgi:hypothetical protein